MTIRVAVIGAGVMGADHARIIANDIPGAELRCICDADAARARGVADETGARDVSTDPLSVIAADGIDAVLVASPDATHAELTLAALAARKPVLCEKPLSADVADCLRVVAAERALGRRLVQVGFMRRFDPGYVEMHARSAEAAFGAPVLMHHVHRNVSAPPSFTGSMAITNSAPHEFDIARFVLGHELVSVAAFQPARPAGAGIGPVLMVLRSAAGVLVEIEVNNNAGYGYDVRCELVCERGTLALRAPVNTEANLGLAAATAYPRDWRPRFAAAYREQNRAWLRGIDGAAPAGASAWDGYVASQVAVCAVEALHTGREVPIRLADIGT